MRFFSTVELVNALEQEKLQGKPGQIAGRLTHSDLVTLDEIGYLPFSPSGGALLFNLLSKLYERTCVVTLRRGPPCRERRGRLSRGPVPAAGSCPGVGRASAVGEGPTCSQAGGSETEAVRRRHRRLGDSGADRREGMRRRIRKLVTSRY